MNRSVPRGHQIAQTGTHSRVSQDAVDRMVVAYPERRQECTTLESMESWRIRRGSYPYATVEMRPAMSNTKSNIRDWKVTLKQVELLSMRQSTFSHNIRRA